MINVTLSRRELESAGACAEGLALYDSIKALYDANRADIGKPGRRGLTIRWSRLATCWPATSYPGFASWLSDHDLVPRANLRGADLYGANLRGANLGGADLYGANLGDWERDGSTGYARRRAHREVA